MDESQARWRAVDAYLVETLVDEDGALEEASAAGRLTTMPHAEVSPSVPQPSRLAASSMPVPPL